MKTCIHCNEPNYETSSTQPEEHPWACEACIQKEAKKKRTYKTLYMRKGVYTAALTEPINQKQLQEYILDILKDKGVILAIQEVIVEDNKDNEK
ncbi:hypothetical protein BCP78_0053 [Bacillus phage BCP78]|uniref:Uncharacterized protein n=3 Tax=Tsarbombavirus BCP78 TaxID=1985182 RepID=J9PRX2_9CAUD|nr:hypothetical protein BCP78_0053 [Bacillus phage BCP78]YP_009783417.1 hypothetical protein QLX27_gp044 [Bacillus phage BCU4]AEW47060.1 hypothetical protein BCP78_0053 [Bacillus phage BCP78]AEW47550.1 hypothetical protein BCU4_0044 [Bacillus phage BCU4]AQN32427.1 hypothetical protein BCP12_004 [Bacillus phage BCP12]